MSSIYDFCLLCGSEATVTAFQMTKDDIARDRLHNEDLRASLYADYHLKHLADEKKHFS